MTDSQTKIITKLLERRQIEADLRALLEVTSEAEFRRKATRIAALGSPILRVIVANLDRASAEEVAAMGAVASLLDREEAVAALREAVMGRQLADRGRVAAISILERFLGWSADDDLLDSVRDPQGLALASLENILDQIDANRALLADYVEGLDRQEPDVVLAVVAALQEMGTAGDATRVVEPLRMMALDVRGEIAAAALDALGAIRRPEAVRALQTLIPTVPPTLQPVARRLLRKLRFRGVEVEPLPAPAPGWRALVSPPDALGQQTVWFILADRATTQANFLNVLLHDRGGAVEAAGHTGVPAQLLVPERSPGYVHDVVFPDGSGSMLLLEAPFDLGRRLVLDALPANRETQIPLAGVLRLYGPWLWAVAGADALPMLHLPEPAAGDTGGLLAHPALTGWTLRSPAVLGVAAEAMRHSGWDLDVWVGRLVGEIFSDPAVALALAERLAKMSSWLLLAGDERQAGLARAAAKGLQASPEDEAFVRALVRRDLEIALQGLSSRPEFQ
ncbi:MAG: hypothetical protein PVG11_05250 [Anaerolineae bacterium]|jgi:hypothetical protein